MDERIIGNIKLVNSNIVFSEKGNNNFVYCDNTFGDVVLENSTITFSGSNSVIYIVGGNKKSIKIKATLNSDTCIYIGRNSSFHKTASAHIAASERSNIIIGKDCLFSRDIWIRTSDSHLIYSTESHKRLNHSKDIIIGDHVWVGQGTMILKGSIVGSGSIIGARSLCTGKQYSSNSSFAGSPARMVSKEGAVFFDKTDINKFDKEQLDSFESIEHDKFIYSYEKEKNIIQDILSFLKEHTDVQERIKFFQNMSDDKNRFAVSSGQLSEEAESTHIYSF